MLCVSVGFIYLSRDVVGILADDELGYECNEFHFLDTEDCLELIRRLVVIIRQVLLKDDTKLAKL